MFSCPAPASGCRYAFGRPFRLYTPTVLAPTAPSSPPPPPSSPPPPSPPPPPPAVSRTARPLVLDETVHVERRHSRVMAPLVNVTHGPRLYHSHEYPYLGAAAGFVTRGGHPPPRHVPRCVPDAACFATCHAGPDVHPQHQELHVYVPTGERGGGGCYSTGASCCVIMIRVQPTVLLLRCYQLTMLTVSWPT